MRAWRLLQIELSYGKVFKRLVGDDRPDLSVEVAIAAERSLQPIQVPLPSLNVQIRAEAMLQKQEAEPNAKAILFSGNGASAVKNQPCFLRPVAKLSRRGAKNE